MNVPVREIAAGGVRYRAAVTAEGGRWIAHAERIDTGERFGAECSGESEVDAVNRLAHWLVWQHEHAAALEALQQAERNYHRTVAGSAFVSPVEGPTAVELQQESLDQLRAARERLDEVRGREP